MVSMSGIARGPDGWLYLVAGDGVAPTPRTQRVRLLRSSSRMGGVFSACHLIFAKSKSSPMVFVIRTTSILGRGASASRTIRITSAASLSPGMKPTRFYHIVPGGHGGWLSRIPNELWRKPPYFPDIVPPVTTLERGSPTGVACYRNVQFPEKSGSFFALDWTFGRVWHVPLVATGSTFLSSPELFLEAIGSDGFAPTDVVVEPKTGDLLISVGGRGTKGSVYRIRYTADQTSPENVAEIQKLQPARRNLDDPPRIFRSTSFDPASDPVSFRITLEAMTRWADQVDSSLLDRAVMKGLDHPDRLIRQAAAGLERTRRRQNRTALADGSLPHSLRACLSSFGRDRVGGLLEATRGIIRFFS